MRPFLIKNYSRMILIAAIMIFTWTLLYTVVTGYANRATSNLSQSVIRFHVVANSDTMEDQLLKQEVKDRIIAYMQPLLKDSKSIEETRKKIKEHLDEIKRISEGTVKDWGKDYPVYTALDYANFPTKSYGDVVFPAGTYEACRIIIGEGKGKNWWCVMYPPLCYVDAASGVVPLEGKQQLENNLNKEQLSIIKYSGRKNYQVRFKIVDMINGINIKEDYKMPKTIK